MKKHILYALVVIMFMNFNFVYNRSDSDSSNSGSSGSASEESNVDENASYRHRSTTLLYGLFNNSKEMNTYFEFIDGSVKKPAKKENTSFAFQVAIANIRTTTPSPYPEPKGPFYDFLVKFCTTIVKRLSSNSIKKFLPMFVKELKNLGCGHLMRTKITRFTKLLHKVQKKKGRVLRSIFQDFIYFLQERRKVRDEFYSAMNSVYGVNDDVRFDNYIFNLQMYGDGEMKLKELKNHTHFIFSRVMFGTFYKAPEEFKDEVKEKFASAIEEYTDEHEDDDG